MKKIRNLLIAVFTLVVFVTGMTIPVSADTVTDLSALKVYAVDASGNKTEVPMNFSATTYTYDLTVMSNVVRIEIEATPADASSKAVVEKDGINTKMDTGTNLTVVAVTSTGGAVQKYTLNTKKLTTAEEATYEAPTTDQNDEESTPNEGTKKNNKDKQVKVGKKKMKISSSFPKSAIPEGFVKSSQEYDGKKYKCIKGEVKELTAFYLYNDDTEGFYIYDAEQDKFYAMNNIKIKSRMYTIVVPDEEDGILKNYDKKNVTIIDTEVKAWALDEEQGMYLVYAMNWNGDTNLYCYDDNEKCFQRYLVSNDANRQSEAAATAYDNLETDYNKLVDKYNFLLKILCGLVVVIIILIFVCINLALNKKEKKIKKEHVENEKDDVSEVTEDTEKNVSEEQIQEDTFDDVELVEEVDIEDIKENPEQDSQKTDLNDIENEPESIDSDIVLDLSGEFEDDKDESEKASAKSRFFGKNKVGRRYGDEPTFGLEEDVNGFYGGEIADEDEIFIDITDDEPKVTEEKIEDDMKKAQHDTEEDIRETLKSMLPDENEDDEDDDFEFIDID